MLCLRLVARMCLKKGGRHMREWEVEGGGGLKMIEK